MEHTTNYTNAFIQVSPDCPAQQGTEPPKPGTVASMQFERIAGAPYALTSDDLLFGIYADRNGIPAREREDARAQFFSKGQPCLRSSPLVKTYGWGIHHDDQARVALYAVGSPEYDELCERDGVTVLEGMRSRRG